MALVFVLNISDGDQGVDVVWVVLIIGLISVCCSVFLYCVRVVVSDVKVLLLIIGYLLNAEACWLLCLCMKEGCSF